MAFIAFGSSALAAPLPGGTLDPTTIPKYVTPLVIPPVMPASPAAAGTYNDPTAFGGVVGAGTQNASADYNIAVRQFQQQILPGGVWNTVNGRCDTFAPSTVWSYGRAEDTLPTNFVAPAPLADGVSFNYPSFTVEGTSNSSATVRWINDLVADPSTCASSGCRPGMCVPAAPVQGRPDLALGQPAGNQLCHGRTKPDRLRNP